MTPDDKQELASLITKTLTDTQELHAAEIKAAIHSHRNGDHHRFIEEFIDERKRKKEQWAKVRANVWTWGIVTALSSFGVAFYNFFIKNPHQ